MKAVWEPWPPAVSVKQQETKKKTAYGVQVFTR